MVIKTLPDPSTKSNDNNHFIPQKQRRSQSGMNNFSFSFIISIHKLF